MPITPFVRKGRTRVVVFCATIAAPAAPTMTEINAGMNLPAQLNEVAGLTAAASFVEAPVLADLATAKISGETTLAETTLTFLDDDLTNTVYAGLPAGTRGYLVVSPKGAAATKRCRTWYVESAGPNDIITVANEPAKFSVGFGMLSAPVDGTIA